METPAKESEVPVTTGSPSVDIVPTDPVEVRALVKNQIEYYFSKENLMHDAYLTSQMDSQMSAPISVIMKFGKIKTLTQDVEVLKEALAESTAVTVVGDRIKSNVKPPGRSTIILRDIASDVPEDEVRAIFAYDGCKPISSIRKDIENTWFVIMDSEEDAKDTVLDLKLKKRTFRGEPVKCRLKTEVVVKSYFPVAAQNPGAQGSYGGQGGYGMMPQYSDMRMYGGYGGNWQNNGQQGDFSKGDGSPGRAGTAQSPKDGAARSAAVPAKDGARKDLQKAGGKDNNGRGDRNKQGAVGSQQQQRGKDGAARPGQPQGRDRLGGKKGEKGAWADGKGQRAPSFDLSGMNFPPLAASDSNSAIPQPGYKEPFIKYSHDDIINIVKNIREVTLPSTIEPERHGFAMTDTANMDLLQRQRTFSIDETREQLRQGKPVQREAVVGGAVDLQSMYFGDSVTVVGAVAATTAPSGSAAAPAAAPAPAPKVGGSWAGILMKSGPPEAAPQPAQAPAPKKQAPAESAPAAAAPAAEDKKAADAKAAPADKKGKGKDTKAKEGKRRGNDEGQQSAETQTSWGGKPSFATILKQQDEAAAAAGTPTKTEETAQAGNRERTRSGSGPSTPNRKAKGTDSVPQSPATGAAWNNRSKGSASNKATTTDSKIKESASDGAWVREKLPPVPDKA